MHEKVKTYLSKLPSPQQEICRELREIIVDTFPNLEETFQNGVPSYASKYYIVGLKEHVNLGFSIEGLTKEEIKHFEGAGKLMRHIKLYTLDDIDREKIVTLLQIVK